MSFLFRLINSFDDLNHTIEIELSELSWIDHCGVHSTNKVRFILLLWLVCLSYVNFVYIFKKICDHFTLTSQHNRLEVNG